MTKADYVGKVVKIGNSYGIRIPKKFLDVAGIKEGDKLKTEIDLDKKEIKVRKS